MSVNVSPSAIAFLLQLLSTFFLLSIIFCIIFFTYKILKKLLSK